jgi:hypothetical protein
MSDIIIARKLVVGTEQNVSSLLPTTTNAKKKYLLNILVVFCFCFFFGATFVNLN